jgi:hypothetical protein
MKIKILRDCIAPQQRTRYCCEVCGNVPTAMEPTQLWKDEEFDPDLWSERTDLKPLVFGEDYTIIEYP